MMSESRHSIDAVAMMRRLRDELDQELAGLQGYDEERQWLDRREVDDERLRRLLEKARGSSPRTPVAVK